MNPTDLKSTTLALADYCRRANWAGWDPYDGLNSRLFHHLPILRNKPCRLVFIQMMKRSPINLRPILGVPPGQNPKGIALFTSALVRLAKLGLAELAEARRLGDSLVSRRCPGRDHSGWGYHFDWQTRGILVPSTTPNIVCTTFVAHAFLDLYAATRHAPYLEVAQSAGRFITNELASDLPADSFCIRYFPAADSSIHNASLLGAAYLARLQSFTADGKLSDTIAKATRYSISRQRQDGSWPYGELPTQKWVDSFHTGYNLIALREIGRHLEIPGLEGATERGYAFYRDTFFQRDGAVKYFHDRTYPVDAHAVGHALLTLAEFSDRDQSALTQTSLSINWALRNLWSSNGHFFYYQFRTYFTHRISYMRWSQAWMLTGLVAVLSQGTPPQPRSQFSS